MASTARLIIRHVAQDVHAWQGAFGRLVRAIGPDFLRDATLTALFVAAPVVVIYSSRSLPTVLLVALVLALMYRAAMHATHGGPPAACQVVRALDPRRLPWWALCTLALIVLAAASSFWALDPGMTFEQATKLFLGFCTVVLIHRCAPPLERPAHRVGAAAGIAVAAVILTVELGTRGVFRGYFYGYNPAFLNRSVVTVSLLMWPALALTTGRYRHYVRVAVIVLVLGAVAVSSSKSALLALAAGLLVTSMALVSLRFARIGVILVGTAAFVAMPLTVTVLSDFAVETGVDEMVDLSSERRLEIWKASAQVAMERPIHGWGLESSRYFGIRDLPGTEWTIGPIHHPHNPILQIWVELGALGVALTGLITVGLVLAVGSLPARRRSFAYGAITATLAVSSVSHGAWQSWWTCLLMVLVVLFAVEERYPPADAPPA